MEAFILKANGGVPLCKPSPRQHQILLGLMGHHSGDRQWILAAALMSSCALFAWIALTLTGNATERKTVLIKWVVKRILMIANELCHPVRTVEKTMYEEQCKTVGSVSTCSVRSARLGRSA